MIRLSQGSVAPVVTTLQILLRRHRPHAQIKSDGQFGSKTKGAAVGFQNQHGLDPDGIVGRFTWTQAMSVSNLLTIDVVDGTDPSLVALEAADIVAAGGDPIVVFGMSGGVDFVMNQIAGRARGPESIALLRFHGHGNRGQQNLTGGDLNGAPHLASVSDGNFNQVQGSLQRISRLFIAFGCVQLLGCSVGGGPKGASLVQKLANVWGVPVTAGIFDQLGGGGNTFKFEGPTVTGFPGGGNLSTWSSKVEASHGNVTMAT
ncbi:MAG: peptidoglycan-binding protein [Pyrinomonadaceae bacterium]|nr:peptidoglycan-binding protein [Pyrinomonadaceae bacterium]